MTEYRENLVHVLLAEELGGERPPDISRKIEAQLRIRRPRAFRWAMVGAAAAVVVAVSLGLWAFAGRYPEPQVTGALAVVGGGPVERGATLKTGDEGGLLVLGGYCRVQCDPHTQVTVEGDRQQEAIYLADGGITCQVEGGKGTFCVRGDTGTIRVTGTEFAVRILEEEGAGSMLGKRMWVHVAVGAVLVSGAWGQQTVTAGETAVTPPEVKIDVCHNDLEHVKQEFTFKEVPSPARDTAASSAKITIVDGARDRNGGGDVGVLIDGRLPTEEDQPGANFFFNAGTEGGRLLIDLGSIINIKQVRTYSWHVSDRSPQIYNLYGADGTAAGFNDKPGKDVDPEKAGWKLIAKVDTRPKSGDVGGQYGVSISDTQGTLGKYRYLLIAASRTESQDPYGNTFFSEINVIDADKPAPPLAIPPGSVKMSAKLAIAIAERKAQKTLEAIKALVQEPSVLADAAQRAETLKKAGPLFERFDKELAEIAKLAPADKGRVDPLMTTADPIRAAFGETATVERLKVQAESKTPKEAAGAQAALARASFLTAGKDAAAQNKALDAFEAALKADPESDTIASYMVQSHDEKTTAPAVVDRIEKIMKDLAQSNTGDFALEDWTCARKLASLTGNPLVIKMPKVDGTAFSTDSLKGKVILVDLWATWCGPCVKELPRVAQVYQKYHDQGLEIVGVSCDRNAEDLKAFLESHKDITWTQLYDPKLPEWKAAMQFGVQSIPKMFLIDKKGIVRTIEAREKMEETNPKLLAE